MYRGKYSNQDSGGEQPRRRPSGDPSQRRADDVRRAQAGDSQAQRRKIQRIKERRRRARRNRRIALTMGLAVIFLLVFFLVRACAPAEETNQPDQTESTRTTEGGSWLDHIIPTESTQPPTETTEAPTEPYVVTTASIGVTGDILVHTPVINAAKTDTGEYDFHESYEFVTNFYSGYDLMIANLEVTLGGTEAGVYTGYPIFNCPDTIIDALQAAGVDMVLTANNHMYDTAYHGLIRTQEVLNEKGMDYIGSRLSEEEETYTVKDINGIRVGMAVYTYETGKTSDGRKSLNGIPLSTEACPLVCSFDYNDLDSFYAEVEETLAAMRGAGAETTMIFIHWGDEYQLSPNDYQTTIAQKLCDLGVDVIVGGHPHVLQPFELLTSDSGHETYCIYSIGNAISNQRREKISRSPNGHTEDGMVFELELRKWNDGTVEIANLDILPTWVNLENKKYTIIPLDTTIEVWSDFEVSDLSEITESYDRIMGVVGESLNELRSHLGVEPIPLSITVNE